MGDIVTPDYQRSGVPSHHANARRLAKAAFCLTVGSSLVGTAPQTEDLAAVAVAASELCFNS